MKMSAHRVVSRAMAREREKRTKALELLDQRLDGLGNVAQSGAGILSVVEEGSDEGVEEARAGITGALYLELIDCGGAKHLLRKL